MSKDMLYNLSLVRGLLIVTRKRGLFRAYHDGDDILSL